MSVMEVSIPANLTLTYLVQAASMETVLASSTWLLRKTGIHNTDDTAATCENFNEAVKKVSHARVTNRALHLTRKVEGHVLREQCQSVHNPAVLMKW